MRRYYYDLHIHSCLSPCADNDNTPSDVAGISKLCGLDIVALTDHNTCKNAPAFFAAAREYGIIPIAGMELTTAEDIHVICLFETLDEAMRFDTFVDSRRIKIKNRTEVFGEQLIMNEHDEVLGQEEHLLSNATSISLEELPEYVLQFGGVCYPAHIDRDANGIIAILGTVPETPHFDFYELHSAQSKDTFSERYGIAKERFVVSSDAHYLSDIRDKENYFELDADPRFEEQVRGALFGKLRCL